MEDTLENEGTYSYENVTKNGIPDEKYQAMLEDERNLKFPYGTITMSGLTVAITYENHQAMLENERILTEELMEREGMEVNHKLREKFPNSYFYQICYDHAIIGVNPITQSIIYDCMCFGKLRVMFCEWTCPDYGDTMYGATDIIKWNKELTPEELQGKIAPTLLLWDNEHFNKFWKDLQYPNW